MEELGFLITWITGIAVGIFIIILFLGKVDSIKSDSVIIKKESDSVIIKKEFLIKNNLAEYDKNTGEFILKIGDDE